MCSSSAVIASVAKQSIGQDQLWIASACAASLAMTANLFIVSGHCERSEAIHWTRSALDCFGLRCKPRNASRLVQRLRPWGGQLSKPLDKLSSGLLRLALQASQ